METSVRTASIPVNFREIVSRMILERIAALLKQRGLMAVVCTYQAHNDNSLTVVNVRDKKDIRVVPWADLESLEPHRAR
ncbi:MAG: hypothetical protein HY006_01265 [Candidatus Sungbacteria bacterium]|nr:hypothetical protein [Candidatus Sungbacteria bacterium]